MRECRLFIRIYISGTNVHDRRFSRSSRLIFFKIDYFNYIKIVLIQISLCQWFWKHTPALKATIRLPIYYSKRYWWCYAKRGATMLSVSNLTHLPLYFIRQFQHVCIYMCMTTITYFMVLLRLVFHAIEITSCHLGIPEYSRTRRFTLYNASFQVKVQKEEFLTISQ